MSPLTNVTELRALEANAAAAYFRAWRGIPIKWRGTTRRPIPEAWKAIEQRTSPEPNSGSAAFVFDLMEPYRPQVDRKIMEFIKGHVNSLEIAMRRIL